MTTLDELKARGRYVSITTYRKDGRGIATPVWYAVEGTELFIWTRSDAWKVKRIRNNSRVMITPCDVRGRIAPGAPSAEGQARVLDGPDSRRARAILSRKYLLVRLTDWFDAALRRDRPGVAIAVTF